MTDIKKIISGFKRFQDNYCNGNQELFSRLKKGQSPDAMVIACSDSRVDPAILMDSELGDLFIVRNVANLVPPYETGGGLHGVSTALEFGVCVLGVQHIIILGHRQCGGIHALMNGIPANASGEFIDCWVNIAARAKDRVLADLPHSSNLEQCHACEKASILVSMENLLTFPWIESRLEQGRLLLHGWYFDIENGTLEAYDATKNHFKPLS